MNTNVTNADDTSKQPPKNSKLKRWIIRLTAYPLFVYVAIIGFLAFNETSLVYPGSKYPKGNWTPAEFAFEEISFKSSDEVELVGWYLPAPVDHSDDENHQPNHAVLLCHGNAENTAQSSQHNGDNFRQVLNANVFVFDYRGYGKSEGTPFEAGVLQDAEAALELLCEKTDKKPEEIILVGHSIGGGPAVHLAQKYQCQTLILQRTFSSLVDAAANQYPWIPVRLIMRNQYPSEERIQSYQGPLFQSHGDADKLIPIELAKRLFEAAPTDNKKFFEVEGMTHWDPLPVEYWGQVRAFVEAAVPQSQTQGAMTSPAEMEQ